MHVDDATHTALEGIPRNMRSETAFTCSPVHGQHRDGGGLLVQPRLGERAGGKPALKTAWPLEGFSPSDPASLPGLCYLP